MRTPVAFLIFNRPDVTAKVFECIRAARPPKLFVVADGARAGKAGEAASCQAARAVIEKVDWECEVFREFSESNLGCMRRVSTGLDWVFSQVEDAIVLEDDCIPDPTFFRYCQELLDRYRNDTRITCVSGDNFQFGRTRGPYSYYFSRYNHCWGWATWRRAWNQFDREMKEWPTIRDNGRLFDILGNRANVKYWTRIFDQVAANKIDSWAFRWTFAAWRESGLTALPNANLVSNIGYDGAGTHTRKSDRYASMATVPMEFPLRHPPFIIRDTGADAYTQSTMFASMSIFKRVFLKAKSLLIPRSLKWGS
ncbi:MAG: glycosyltransferase family 2 protein [Fibrobacteria bacterium]